jgi:hypothetical protein
VTALPPLVSRYAETTPKPALEATCARASDVSTTARRPWAHPPLVSRGVRHSGMITCRGPQVTRPRGRKPSRP